MKEKRTFKKAEKLAILKEASEQGVKVTLEKQAIYPANKAVFASAEKPIKYEIIGDGLVNGTHIRSIDKTIKDGETIENVYYTWDNVHWWGGGGTIHASTPGAFHAIHVHWRWGLIIQNKPNAVQGLILPEHTGDPQFKGSPVGGALIDPDITNQSIRFAIIKNDGLDSDFTKQTSEDFSYHFKHLSKLPATLDTAASKGEDLILFYSAEVYATQTNNAKDLNGNVFLHGIFFAHQVEQAAGALIGEQAAYYVYPDNPSHQWIRNPYT